MGFNLNNIGKLVKMANGVANPKQGINMLIGEIQKKDPNMATALRTEHQKMGKEVPEFFEDRLKSMAECYTKKMSKVMYMIDLNK